MKYLLIFLIMLSGCKSFDTKLFSKILLPVNIAGAYFGNVAMHEYGHAITSDYYGNSNIKVDLLPSHEDGSFYLGRTTYEGRNHSGINIAGPSSTFLSSVVFRSALRSGEVPQILQPLFGWLDVFGRISTYYHIVGGLTKVPNMDLAKEDRWVSVAFLGINIIYDVVSWVLSDDDFETYFGVLFGEKFYGETDKK